MNTPQPPKEPNVASEKYRVKENAAGSFDVVDEKGEYVIGMFGGQLAAKRTCDVLVAASSAAADEVGRLREELRVCRANHADMVNRNKLLRERLDLPADQIKPRLAILDALDAARAECAAWRTEDSSPLMTTRGRSFGINGIMEWAQIQQSVEDAMEAHDTLCPNWNTPTTGGQGETKGATHEK